MLFTNVELKSIYDFEHNPDEIPDNMASIASLAGEIKRIIDKLCDIIEYNKEQDKKKKEYRSEKIDIGIKITDNCGNAIKINEDSFFSSKTANQADINKELNPSRPIPKQLEAIGIVAPTKGTPDYKRYLQLLYFLYMARYVIFQENFFLYYDENKRTSSELSPVDRASSGKYCYFILNNVLENEAVYNRYNYCDEWLSKIEWNIVQCLDELLSEDHSPSENEAVEIAVQRIIDSAKEMTIEPLVESNPLNKMVEWAYRLTAVAYAKDMLNNLDPKLHPFKFPEIEIRLNPIWMKKKLAVTPGLMSEDIQNFLREKDCIRFCKQIDIVKNSPSDETKGNAYSFVYEFIEYDRTSIRNQIGRSYFVKMEEDGTETIPAPIVALIVKTFIDIYNSNMDLYMPMKSGSKWIGSRKLTSRLSSTDQTSSVKVPDLAMRLFLVALKSELMNMINGYGYYYFFATSALNSYRLEQKIRLAIYETDKPYDWAYRSLEILAALKELKQQ